MSRFFSSRYEALTPYTPGEQPQERQFIKLNTNESPFPPSPFAQRMAREAAGDLQLYSDPTCRLLVETASSKWGVDPEEILFSNGSDEILYFSFLAFCDEKRPAVFPDITYGFYPVFAQLAGIAYEEIPLDENFRVRIPDYFGCGKTVFIANPNAPTGIALSKEEIEHILSSNPDSVVIIDEAYVDFGGESVMPLIKKYKNLVVIGTFSKSRSMAGARLGFAVADQALIRDLNTVKYSFNPYNINRMTMAAGTGALIDEAYFKRNCATICENRRYLTEALAKLGFETLPSSANFIFTKNAKLSGRDYYEKLKEKGVLVRWFSKKRLEDHVRISIGSREEIDILLKKTAEILEEEK